MALASVTNAPAISASEGVDVTSAPLSVEHIKVTTMKPYPEVKAGIEKLGRFDDSVRALLKNNDIEGLRAALKRADREEALNEFRGVLARAPGALRGQRRRRPPPE